MKRLLGIGILSLAAAIVLFAASHYMRAQGGAPHAPNFPHSLVTPLTKPTTLMNHSLFRTYFTEGIPDTYYEGETWITLDGQNKFFCPLPCTLEIHETAEFGGVTSTNNWLYLLAQVDGQDVPNNGAASEVPSDYGWMEAFTDQTVALEPGSHTVQSFAGTDDGAVLWSFYNSYRVYIP